MSPGAPENGKPFWKIWLSPSVLISYVLSAWQFIAHSGEKATTAKQSQLDKSCEDLLISICRKYDDLSAVDRLSLVSQKVEGVKLVMQDNIDIALQNCVKLETIGKVSGQYSTCRIIF